MALRIEQVRYAGWPECYRIFNGLTELVLTGDIGPRIMHYGFEGGQNFLAVFADQAGKSGEAEWRARGGHRLWIAPEDPVMSYAPDNSRVKVSIRGDLVESTGPVEPLTGLEKQIAVRMSPEAATVEILHRIRNAGTKPYRLAPWAPTILSKGGTAIHAFPPRGTHPHDLLPTNPLVMWAFTNLADPRWTLLEKYLCLRHDPSLPAAQKLGSYHPKTWGAYLLNRELFVKRYRATSPSSSYPDLGCSFETFANGDFLELETLGPLVTLAPGESVDHVETWSLHSGVAVDHWTDAEIDRTLTPFVNW